MAEKGDDPSEGRNGEESAKDAATEAPGGGPEKGDGDAAGETGENEDGDAPSSPEGPANGRRRLIIAATAAVLVVVAGAAVFFTGLLDSIFGGGPSQKAVIELPEKTPPVFVELPEIVTDLKSGRCRAPFIKLKVVVELPGSDQSSVKENEVRILDGMKVFVRDRTRADLVGKAGSDLLRQGFLAIVNNAIAPARAEAILFREIILQ